MIHNVDTTPIKGYMENDIRISIPRVSSKLESNNESYMVYHIVLETNNKRWEVEKRFSDFVQLSDWIVRTFPFVELESLPSKITLFSVKENTALKRRPILESFLVHIVKMYPFITTTYEFRDFFQIELRVHQPFKLEHPSGILFIKIIGAKNLSLNDKKVLKYFSEVYQVNSLEVDPNLKLSLTTDTVSDVSSPNWNQEMIFHLESRKNPIRIQVWNTTRTILSSILHSGFVDIDIKKLQIQKLYSLTFPLINHLNNDSCIHIQLYFTPKVIEKPIAELLHYFRIELVKSSIRIGENLEGNIILNVGNPIDASSIKINLIGMTISWESHDVERIDPCKQVFCNINQTLWESETDKTIESGSYAYPFKIRIEDSIGKHPFSFRSHIGSVFYKFNAILNQSYDKIEHNVPITVKPDRKEFQPNPLNLKETKNILFKNSKVSIDFEVSSTNINIPAGTTQTLILKVENHPSSINSIDVTLLKRIKFFYEDKIVNHSNEVISTFNFNQSCPSPRGHLTSFEIPVRIDKNTGQSLPVEYGKCVDINYYITFDLNMEDLADNVVQIRVPILIIKTKGNHTPTPT